MYKRLKINLTLLLLISISLFAYLTIAKSHSIDSSPQSKGKGMKEKVVKSEVEWKEQLTPDQYKVLREKGTERPYTGKYWNFEGEGTYKCAGCGAELFDSNTKFDSGCGWPSFYDVKNNKNVITEDDYSLGMHRIEVMCAKCGGHLGHVFDDGPNPTGLRYCINSVSIDFEKKSDQK